MGIQDTLLKYKFLYFYINRPKDLKEIKQLGKSRANQAVKDIVAYIGLKNIVSIHRRLHGVTIRIKSRYLIKPEIYKIFEGLYTFIDDHHIKIIFD